MSSAVAALAPGTKGFYRLQSCTTSGCGGKSDELWTTTKAVSGHATYKPYFSYVHWYAPDGQ